MRFVTGTESGKGGSYYGGTLMVPGSDKSFQPTDAITVECFVCTTGGVFNTFSPIFGKRNSGDYANESWALYMTSSGKLAVRLNMKVSGASPDYGQGVAINDGKWHHVAMTYDKTDGVCRVYVDYAQSFTFSPAGGGAISYLDSSEYTNFHKIMSLLASSMRSRAISSSTEWPSSLRDIALRRLSEMPSPAAT